MKSSRSVASKVSREKSAGDEASGLSKNIDDKQRATPISTPRSYLATKASAADIYAQKRKPASKVGPNPATPKTRVGEAEKVVTAKAVLRSNERTAKLTSGQRVLQREDSFTTSSRVSAETLKSKIKLDNSTSRSILGASKSKSTIEALKNRSSLEGIKSKSSVEATQSRTPSETAKSRSVSEASKSKSTGANSKTKSNSKAKSITDSSNQSEKSSKSTKTLSSEVKTTKKSGVTRTAKDLPFVGLLVNSPPAQRRNITQNAPVSENLHKDGSSRRSPKREKQLPLDKVSGDKLRQRGKTRTLDDEEVKFFTPDAVDNNVEMKYLTQKLRAKPEAFFVDLEENKASKLKTVSRDSKAHVASPVGSEEDCSYEDDFDSYESDFDSYESEDANSESDMNLSLHECTENDTINEPKDILTKVENGDSSNETCAHVPKMDEEKMLDSGNFDLREGQRSATKAKPAMGDIREDAELALADSRKHSSLTDEGFLEMSSSSVLSSTKTLEKNYTIDRPSFIDLTKARDNRRRRRTLERQRQRAEDLLSMISLHQVSYSLFDMKPIAYDTFMAIYGNANGAQAASQTYDDGVTEEVQTEDIVVDNKWTQHPVAFSHHEAHITKERQKSVVNKYDFLWNAERTTEDGYKGDPLKIFLDQKYGVGCDRIAARASYESALRKPTFNGYRLSKFLLKAERKLTRVLRGAESAFVNKSKWPFSEGYKDVVRRDCQLFFLRDKPVSDVVFSDASESFLLTVHQKIPSEPGRECSFEEALRGRCVVCVWDVGAAGGAPLKVLAAVENVAVCRLRGGAEGLVVAALDDGSLHLWDLSEQDSWHAAVARAGQRRETRVGERDGETTTAESDSRWNHETSWIETLERQTLRSCAYASSALALGGGGGGGGGARAADRVAGLELLPQERARRETDRKMIGQICSLQREGILTFWLIVQERQKPEEVSADIGTAYWSKMRLQKGQVIHLCQDIGREMSKTDKNFNLATAKRRNTLKRAEQLYLQENIKKKMPKLEKKALKSIDFDDFDSWDGVGSGGIDLKAESDVASVAKLEALLPECQSSPEGWESGVVCTELKIMCAEGTQRFLVAKNCGEVLCCTRSSGSVQVMRYQIGCNASTVTALEPSRSLPYFLAGTDTGLVRLCSLAQARVLLTLDCAGGAGAEAGRGTGRHRADAKGRYPGSASGGPASDGGRKAFAEAHGGGVRSLHWLARDPCALLALSPRGALSLWELARGDMAARWRAEDAAVRAALGRGERLAVVTAGGGVEVHRVSAPSRPGLDPEALFRRYVSLL